MLWVILISVWGGFLLGVLFMAILSMAREEKPRQGEQHRLELISTAKPTPIPPREQKIKAMHG